MVFSAVAQALARQAGLVWEKSTVESEKTKIPDKYGMLFGFSWWILGKEPLVEVVRSFRRCRDHGHSHVESTSVAAQWQRMVARRAVSQYWHWLAVINIMH